MQVVLKRFLATLKARKGCVEQGSQAESRHEENYAPEDADDGSASIYSMFPSFNPTKTKPPDWA